MSQTVKATSIHIPVVVAVLVGGCATPKAVMHSVPLPTVLGETVDLDFVERHKRSEAWLEAQLSAQGFARCEGCGELGHYTIVEQLLETADPAVAGYANRIRAFHQYRGSTNRPWLRLNLRDPDGRTAVCVTSDPAQQALEVHPTDFAADHFLVTDLDAPSVAACLVPASADAPHRDLSRAQFRTTYFNPNGALRIEEHDDLAKDRGFILTALEHGFYTYDGCYTGYLQIR